MRDYIIGIDIGGTKIATGVFDPDFALLAQHTQPFNQNASAEGIFSCLCNGVLAALADAPAEGSIAKIGVSIPGIVNAAGTGVFFTPNTPSIWGFALGDRLRQRFNAKVQLENDANAAALAEYTLGAGRGFLSMIYSTISTGIGAGIILDGRLYRGSNRAAGEIGHMILVPGGEPCGCGNNGCVEAYAGGANFPKQIQARIDAGEPTLMRELAKQHGRIDGHVLAEAYHAGDSLAAEFLERITRLLGTLYYNIYRILDIQCFVLGGGLTNLGETLLQPIRDTITDLRRSAEEKDIPLYIKKAHFSSWEIGLYGAALITQ